MADEKSTGKRTLGVVEGRDSVSQEARSAEAEATVNEQIEALKAEIGRLKESAGLIAEGTGQLAAAKAESLRDDVRQTIQANPLAALAGAALIGYLCGLRCFPITAFQQFGKVSFYKVRSGIFQRLHRRA